MIKFVNNGELLREAVSPKAFTNVLDTFLNEAIRNYGGTNPANIYRPAADIIENENQYELRLSLAGYTKEQIALELKDNKLTVSNRLPENVADENINKEETSNNEAAEKVEVNEPRFLVREIYSGNFSRTFKLPENADKSNISAEFKDGILYIAIAKADPKAGVTFIEVK